jgi:hypothetical protein
MSDVLPVDATITIRAETSVADPDTCKFTVSRTVHPGGGRHPCDELLVRPSPSGYSRFPASPTCSLLRTS